MSLTIAQRHAWSLARSLMVCVTLFHAGKGYAAVPTSDFDGLDAGTSPRELAFGLAFPRLHPLAGAIWKGSSERRHTLRLIAEARRLVNGGYLWLLKHR